MRPTRERALCQSHLLGEFKPGGGAADFDCGDLIDGAFLGGVDRRVREPLGAVLHFHGSAHALGLAVREDGVGAVHLDLVFTGREFHAADRCRRREDHIIRLLARKAEAGQRQHYTENKRFLHAFRWSFLPGGWYLTSSGRCLTWPLTFPDY